MDDARLPELLDVLARAGCTFDRAEALERARAGDTVFTWKDGFRVGVFEPFDPFYDEAARRPRAVRFRDREVPFLDAESLAVFKLLFFRPKDLADLAGLLAVQRSALDHAWVRARIAEMLGEDDERVATWDRLVATHGG